MAKYSYSIMSRCRQRLGLEKDDESMDALILHWSSKRILDECLIWEGIIGFTELILSWIKELHGVREVE